MVGFRKNKNVNKRLKNLGVIYQNYKIERLDNEPEIKWPPTRLEADILENFNLRRKLFPEQAKKQREKKNQARSREPRAKIPVSKKSKKTAAKAKKRSKRGRLFDEAKNLGFSGRYINSSIKDLESFIKNPARRFGTFINLLEDKTIAEADISELLATPILVRNFILTLGTSKNHYYLLVLTDDESGTERHITLNDRFIKNIFSLSDEQFNEEVIKNLQEDKTGGYNVDNIIEDLSNYSSAVIRKLTRSDAFEKPKSGFFPYLIESKYESVFEKMKPTYDRYVNPMALVTAKEKGIKKDFDFTEAEENCLDEDPRKDLDCIGYAIFLKHPSKVVEYLVFRKDYSGTFMVRDKLKILALAINLNINFTNCVSTTKVNRRATGCSQYQKIKYPSNDPENNPSINLIQIDSHIFLDELTDFSIGDINDIVGIPRNNNKIVALTSYHFLRHLITKNICVPLPYKLQAQLAVTFNLPAPKVNYATPELINGYVLGDIPKAKIVKTIKADKKSHKKEGKNKLRKAKLQKEKEAAIEQAIEAAKEAEEILKDIEKEQSRSYFQDFIPYPVFLDTETFPESRELTINHLNMREDIRILEDIPEGKTEIDYDTMRRLTRAITEKDYNLNGYTEQSIGCTTGQLTPQAILIKFLNTLGDSYKRFPDKIWIKTRKQEAAEEAALEAGEEFKINIKKVKTHKIICVAHNFGFDGSPIMRFNHPGFKIINRIGGSFGNTKSLEVTWFNKNITFIDSMSFLKCRLAQFPTIFKLPQHKEIFPYDAMSPKAVKENSMFLGDALKALKGYLPEDNLKKSSYLWTDVFPNIETLLEEGDKDGKSTLSKLIEWANFNEEISKILAHTETTEGDNDRYKVVSYVVKIASSPSYLEFKNNQAYLKNSKDFIELLEKGNFFHRPKRDNETRKLGDTIKINNYNDYYCKLDVEILQVGFDMFRRQVKELSIPDGEKPIEVFDVFTTPMLGLKAIKLEPWFKRLGKVKGALRSYINKTCVGGRVCTYNNELQDCRNIPLNYIDITSLYPAAFTHLTSVPVKAPKLLEKVDTEKQYTELKDLYENLKLPYSDNPEELNWMFMDIEILEVGKPRGIPNLSSYDENHTRVWEDKPGKYTLNHIQLLDLCEFQKVTFRIEGGIYFPKSKLDISFSEFFTKYFETRRVFKKQKNPIELVYKLIMNAIHGKMTQNNFTKDERFYDLDFTDASNDITQEEKDAAAKDKAAGGKGKIRYRTRNKNDLDRHLMKHFNEISGYRTLKPLDRKDTSYRRAIISQVKPEGEKPNQCQLASIMYAFSKRLMNRVIYLADDNGIKTFYSDTDSMFIPAADTERLNQLHKEKFGYPLLGDGDLGTFHNDFEVSSRKGSLPFGKGVFFGKKSYLLNCYYEKQDSEGTISYHIDQVEKLKGIPKTAIKEYYRANNCGIHELIETFLSKDVARFDLSSNQVRIEIKGDFQARYNRNFKRCVSFGLTDEQKNHKATIRRKNDLLLIAGEPILTDEGDLTPEDTGTLPRNFIPVPEDFKCNGVDYYQKIYDKRQASKNRAELEKKRQEAERIEQDKIQQELNDSYENLNLLLELGQSGYTFEELQKQEADRIKAQEVEKFIEVELNKEAYLNRFNGFEINSRTRRLRKYLLENEKTTTNRDVNNFEESFKEWEATEVARASKDLYNLVVLKINEEFNKGREEIKTRIVENNTRIKIGKSLIEDLEKEQIPKNSVMEQTKQENFMNPLPKKPSTFRGNSLKIIKDKMKEDRVKQNTANKLELKRLEVENEKLLQIKIDEGHINMKNIIDSL